MSDIELVIKVPEEKYNVIKSDLYGTFPAEMKEWGLEAIKNSTPLQEVKDKIDQKQYDFMADGDYNEGIRFGLMLAYQIIDKYKSESEVREEL